jgi:hypothetical protein
MLLGWTQRAAAERLSITTSCVCEAEHGNRSDATAARCALPMSKRLADPLLPL